MTILALILPLAAANPVAAAESLIQNPNWSAWHGCWQAEGAPANELVCIAPVAGGVRVATLIDGSLRDESRILADGTSRRVQSVGCTGTERAYWSKDRRRVFLESDVACGASGRRSVRGLFAFVAPDEWISVQAATEGDSVATRVVRFTSVEPRSVPASASAFAARSTFSDGLLDVDEASVNEAVSHIGAEAVQEWMRLSGEPFELGYQGQDRGNGSALEQVGRMSNPVVVREVVRVVERPVYVYDNYYDHYRWHYSPWGYHYHGWYWHRPVLVVRWPIVIYRNSHYRRDYWRDRGRYVRYDNGRYNRDRYDRDRDDDRDDRWRDRNDGRGDNGGRVTRGGYTSGRQAQPTTERVTPNRARAESTGSAPQTTRSATTRTSRDNASSSRSSGPSRGSVSTSRGSGGSSRSAVTRTARARSSSRN